MIHAESLTVSASIPLTNSTLLPIVKVILTLELPTCYSIIIKKLIWTSSRFPLLFNDSSLQYALEYLILLISCMLIQQPVENKIHTRVDSRSARPAGRVESWFLECLAGGFTNPDSIFFSTTVIITISL